MFLWVWLVISEHVSRNGLLQNSDQVINWINYVPFYRNILNVSKSLNELTHWGRVTHICVGNLTIIGSDNGLSPGRRQAITWTNFGILLIIGPLGTNFSEMLIEFHTFSFKKIHLKIFLAAILSRSGCVKTLDWIIDICFSGGICIFKQIIIQNMACPMLAIPLFRLKYAL